MKKLATLAVSAIIALGLVPAAAGPLPQPPNSCLIAGGAQSSGEGTETCSFVTADAPAHGYLGLTPNDFVIFVDGNGNNLPDSGEVLAEVSPSGFDPIGGTIEVAAGTTVSVHLSHGCAGPACGWAGALLVG